MPKMRRDFAVSEARPLIDPLELRASGQIKLPEPDVTLNDCDFALGNYLRGWGTLEQALFNLFHKLLDANIISSHIVFAAGIGHQTLREIMLALGGQRLASSVELISLMESAKKATATCNHIVHGVWLLELTVKTDRRSKEETKTATWVRFYQPTDAEVLAQWNNKTLQEKVRTAHTFPLPRLFALANEANTLAQRINTFCDKVTLLPVRTEVEAHTLLSSIVISKT
jgi:hypothetical protein